MDNALEQLRKEIQTDRIEIQRTINVGFDRILEKIDEHTVADTEHFANLNAALGTLDKRLTVVEESQRTMKNAITGTVSVAFTALVGWIVNMFGK